MAGINFHILLTLFFIALAMFNHCKAPPPTDPSPNNATSSTSFHSSSSTENAALKQDCNKYLPLLPKNNRSCNYGNSINHYICYPLALSEGDVVGRNRNIKPSRRFIISSTNAETNEATGNCPTKAESRNIGVEFERGPNTYLDDYHQLFLDLVEDLGWPECRIKVATTDSTETTTVETTTTKTTKTTTETTTAIPTTIPTTTLTTTSTTTPTTTTMTTTVTTIATTTRVVVFKEEPKSYPLVKALRNGCNISIAATLPQNGTFAIQFLHNVPEPVPGIGETMLKINVTDKKIRMGTRFHQSEGKEYERKDLIDVRKELKVKIRVLDDEYIVSFGDNNLLAFLPNYDPLWAINYTYFTGDLKLKKKNPVNVQCANEKKPAGSIDWSNKLSIEKPTAIVLRNLHFKGDGALVVYFLKGCSKFDMTVCDFAMEFELSFFAEKGSKLLINVHRRSPKLDVFGNPSKFARTTAKVSDVPISSGHKYDVTIDLVKSQRMGLKVHGHEWQKAEDIVDNMNWELWEDKINDVCAEDAGPAKNIAHFD